MIKTISKVGNSQGVIFDAALMELAQPHPRPLGSQSILQQAFTGRLATPSAPR